MNKQLIMPVLAMLAFFPLLGQNNINIPSDSLLRREAARMLMVGFRGDKIDDSSDAARYVRDLHVGSIVLFDMDLTTDGPHKIGTRNITSKEQLTKLTRQLQSYADEPLIIAADQEGGMVARLKTQYGFKPTVNALYLGTQDNRDTTLYYAMRIAREMQECGVNLNLAPVLDIHNENGPHLGHFKRCFSDDVDVITRNAGWFIDAHYKHGILCAVKHFPGHGSATGDTHKGLVDVTNTWQRCELAPYRDLANKWYPRPPLMVPTIGMVMTAHVINRQLDPSGLPASLSPKITSYLRDTLGFQGIIVTDDLAMGAIVSQYSFEKAVSMSVMAGADLLCLSNNGGTYDVNMVPRAVKVIKQMVENGEISEERIRQSAERVRDYLQQRNLKLK